jgi:uncharacterized protein (TIGR03083 family)
MKPVEPILTLELFPPLSRELIELLKPLPWEDWARPTVCGPWTVKDVAAHLLGGNLGRLWSQRETSAETGSATETFDELVALINASNAEWVRAARRFSPELLVEFLELSDRRLYEYFQTLEPDQPARIPVSWAGQEESPNWFDVAREYTEKWLHQQHIREALGAPLLTERRWLYPVLDTFLRALPHTYRSVDAAEGSVVSFRILGEAGGSWSLRL